MSLSSCDGWTLVNLFTALNPPSETPPALASPPEPEVITTTVKPNGHGRWKLPEHLKRQTEIIDVPESVKQATGDAWQ